MADTFEYKIIVSDSDDETDEETLNGHGAQGWELVNAVADVRANDDALEGAIESGTASFSLGVDHSEFSRRDAEEINLKIVAWDNIHGDSK